MPITFFRKWNMKTNIQPNIAKRYTASSRVSAFLAGMLAVMASLPAASVDISDTPLYVGSNVPGNLALTPSVEFPTAISVANLTANYTTAIKFVGYFDSLKCYSYHYAADEAERHFYPIGMATGYECGANQWSGNFMNWAATQTIDPFRSALTGGLRVKDTVNETWVEKAIADRDNTANFPRRSVNNAGLVNGATPAEWGSIQMRIDGLGNKMRFTQIGGGDVNLNVNPNLVAFNPGVHNLDFAPLGTPAVNANQAVYEVSVRVKVCDATIGLEPNCKLYPSGYAKPEGLIHEYSNRILYSVFGYQNRDDVAFDGGILRANQKFVGPQTFYPDLGPLANPNTEWDAATGILVQNPDVAAAAATTAAIGVGVCTVPGGCDIRNSGVINYINKFGQLGTGKNIKSYDNVSELYYTATRYFKNLGNVVSYSTLSGNVNQRYQQADGFPVITNWQDPIRYQCQTNVILGIGDTNTWQDKNLPGPTNGTGEPGKPPEVLADDTVNVVDNLRDIRLMEGDSAAAALTRATANTYSHANNSAYMAALAYDAHTRDIRPPGPRELPGKQTISTHWVDVVEFGGFKNTNTNQFWLTAKYGGFRVPPDYDPDTMTTPLPNAMWWGTGDLVNGNAAFPRADNFYIASDAKKMVDSLTLAFQNIADELVGSGGSFASNTTKLETGAMTYQAQFYSSDWRGELTGYDVNTTTGALTFSWSANSRMPTWTDRVIKFSNAGTLADFEPGAPGLTALTDSNVINYLRGERANESETGLRIRSGLLGDIVNSQPVYVGAPNGRLHIGASFTGASAYPAFAAAQATRTPVVYVGANDGMLHGFNGTNNGTVGGQETFAFIPTEVMPRLEEYTQRDYQHQYYVDGELTVADVYDTGLGGWRTILVGTLGRGGRSIFALDVTDPADIELLWEKDETDIPQLGNNLGKPIIAHVADGNWQVLLGNGPNSSGGAARLIMVGALSGTVTTSGALAAGDNGLSGVLAWSSVVGGFTDTVYAGDLEGNLWKITGLTSTPAATLLFTANNGTAQPITAAPLVARDPATSNTWIFFGTGRYLNASDIADKDVQSWYGLIDRNTVIPTDRSTLAQIDILDEGAIDIMDNSDPPIKVGETAVRTIEDNATAGADGWYMDLVSPVGGAEGERMVVSNLFQGLALIGTTRIPDSEDVCSPSGKGYVMALNPFTGGRLPQTFFDTNGDGVFNSADTLNGVPVSGIGLPSSPNAPIFIGDIMQVSLDNGSSATIKTNTTSMSATRVSWREIIRD